MDSWDDPGLQSAFTRVAVTHFSPLMTSSASEHPRHTKHSRCNCILSNDDFSFHGQVKSGCYTTKTGVCRLLSRRNNYLVIPH